MKLQPSGNNHISKLNSDLNKELNQLDNLLTKRFREASGRTKAKIRKVPSQRQTDYIPMDCYIKQK